MFAAAALVLGLTGCSKSDNPVDAPVETPTETPDPVDISALEKELIGVWWDEFEYEDVTENGDPFTSALLVVWVDEDHTGTIYLAVYDDESEEPLEVYGSPEESGFTWKVLADGTVQLGDPTTGETYSLARTRANGDYGNNMTDPSKANMTLGDNQLAVNNGNYSGTLTKANAGKASEIQNTIATGNILSNVSLKNGGKTPEGFSSDNIR